MGDTRLYDWLATRVLDFRMNPDFRPVAVSGPFGDHGCMYDTDEDGREYVIIGFNMPNGVYAEIEDGTYGRLQGWRIYLVEEDEADLSVLNEQMMNDPLSRGPAAVTEHAHYGDGPSNLKDETK